MSFFSFSAYLYHDLQNMMSYALAIKVFCSLMLVFYDSKGVCSNSFSGLQAKVEKISQKLLFLPFLHFEPIFSMKYLQDAMRYALIIKKFFVL